MDYTKDYLLDKQIKIFQPVDGYRASTDAIILSSVVSKVKKNDTILDVGSGTGAISLCLAHRYINDGVKITGLELQKELCDLSNLSSKENGFSDSLKYINCDIRKKTESIDFCSFSHVITNPPYSEKDLPSPNSSKAQAHNHSDFSLGEWIKFCIKMIKPKGFFYMINRAEALDEILCRIKGKLGNIRIIPIYSKEGQEAKRVIVIAQKDSKAATSIVSSFIVHNSNGEYSDKANEILRKGQAFF
ncbi:MAG: methyltransferase [Lactobacillaceae bacterium]|nr:methyltransferase [Lactobacillaceae bacterium]